MRRHGAGHGGFGGLEGLEELPPPEMLVLVGQLVGLGVQLGPLRVQDLLRRHWLAVAAGTQGEREPFS